MRISADRAKARELADGCYVFCRNPFVFLFPRTAVSTHSDFAQRRHLHDTTDQAECRDFDTSAECSKTRQTVNLRKSFLFRSI